MTAAPLSDNVSRSGEDYLKAIYGLAVDGRHAATTEIAHALEVSPASVSGMLKRLAEQGLVEHAPYKGVLLTDDGRRVALRMVRRHRIIESYLVDRLGFTWDTVHDEAERLEHAVSDVLVERMAHALGNPTVDPHGDPIPEADGTIAEPAGTLLPDLDVGAAVRIVRVTDGAPERLRYLAAFGLVPGAEITVLDRQPFQGPITLRTGDGERVIGFELARTLLCRAPEVA